MTLEFHIQLYDSSMVLPKLYHISCGIERGFSTARPANPYDPNGDNETTGRDREQTKDYAPHVGAVSCLKRQ